VEPVRDRRRDASLQDPTHQFGATACYEHPHSALPRTAQSLAWRLGPHFLTQLDKLQQLLMSGPSIGPNQS
jgi:hypothetical protein